MATENDQQYSATPTPDQANPYQQPTPQPYQPAADAAAPAYEQPAPQPYQPVADPAAQPYEQPTPQPYQPVADPAAQPYAQPAPQQYQQPYAQPAVPMAAAPVTQVEDKSTLFIVLSVVEFLLAGGLLAIIPLVLSINYRKACRAGLAADAAKKRKNVIIALVVVGIIGLLVDFVQFSGALS